MSMALAALMATGCAGNWTLANAKVGQAERAVDEAKQSNATLNAAADLKLAEDRLVAARAAIVRQDATDAIRQAEAAMADADYARARSFNERVRKVVDDMRQNIQTLRQELDRLPQ
jgi:hypothetical protein